MKTPKTAPPENARHPNSNIALNSIQEVPFRVSARTARLIGRENVATAEGAITELVKNSYDADASFCIVRITPTYSGVPEEISKDEFGRLKSWGLSPENHFDLVGETAKLRACLADEHSPEAKLVQHLVTISVIDDGAGMGDDAIRDAWMVIGTNSRKTVHLGVQSRHLVDRI